MKFGLIVPQGWREDLPGRDFETMVGVAQAAERLGFESIWLYDHLQTRAGDPDALFECWTSLAALARETSTVQLGQIVTSALYRNPGLLAQMAATVDAASGGRVIVGLGAGWDEREYREFGYGDLPPVRARLAHLEETLRVLRRRTRLPILVGGAGEKVLLRLVAQYADACNFTDSFDPRSTGTSSTSSAVTATRSAATTTQSRRPPRSRCSETTTSTSTHSQRQGSRRSSSTSIRRPTCRNSERFARDRCRPG